MTRDCARRNGGQSLPPTARGRASVEDRFWAKVDLTPSCWLWTATVRFGYGRFWDGERYVPAHRFAYELLVGPIPDGLTLDHLCRVRHCVNPAHLEPVTNRVNVLRGVGPSAVSARKTHCKYGHEFTPENTRPKSSGGRECRICRRRLRREYKARRRERSA